MPVAQLLKESLPRGRSTIAKAQVFWVNGDEDDFALYYRGRAEILSVRPGVALAFKRTAPAVKCCKDEQERCSRGRDRIWRRYDGLEALFYKFARKMELACVVPAAVRIL